MPKLVWRVKLVAELRPGVMTETEVAGFLLHSAGPRRDDRDPKLLCDDRLATDRIYRPASKFRFSTATPMAASVCWPAKPRSSQPRSDQRLVATHCRFY